MKKVLLLILSAWLTTIAFAATEEAATEEVDGITWTYSVSGGKASVGGGYSSPAVPTSTTGAITIPSKLGDYPVTSIGYYAFYNCSGLTSVTIPSSVTSIGNQAFRGCSSLTSVTIPEGVTSIGDSAFYGCSSLFKDVNGVQYEGEAKVVLIDVPTSTTGNFTIPNSVRFIHSEAFRYCSSLTSVTIPSSVTTIGDYAFHECSSLTSVTIPSSVTTIGGSAFSSCSSLKITVDSANTVYASLDGALFNKSMRKLIRGPGDTSNYTIPSSVTSIGSYAFENCSSLTSVTIPSSVTSISNSAFWGCAQLKIMVDSENQYYSSKDGALLQGRALIRAPGAISTYRVPEGVYSIDYGAFTGLSDLTSVIIPEGVTSIGDHFYNCDNLKFMYIPSTVTEIRYLPHSLETLVFLPKPGTVQVEVDTFSGLWLKSFTGFWAPEGLSLDGLEEIGIPEGVRTLDVTFWSNFPGILQNGSITSLRLPESLEYITADAFASNHWWFQTLVASYIPDYHYESGFDSVISSVEELKIPPTTTRLRQGAFDRLPITITEIEIPEGVQTIEEYALDGLELTDLVIPTTVTDLSLTYSNLIKQLQTISVREGNLIYSSDNNVIYNNVKKCLMRALPSALVGEFQIPDGIENIEDRAFYECSKLTSITIPNSVVKIGRYAFSGCNNLTSFHLPASVRSMPADAFPPSSSMLVSLTVDEGNPLYCAENGILYNKDKTRVILVAGGGISGDIVLPETVTSIAENAFACCSKITSITVPSGVTSIGKKAFYGIDRVNFLGNVPQNFVDAFDRYSITGAWTTFTYPEEYASAWQHAIQIVRCKEGPTARATADVSAEMTSPKTMKVTYTIKSALGKAKVYALAFENGTRSFANVVPIKTMATDSPEVIPNGNEVITNVPHTFIWNVPADWDTDLSKVMVEILVQEGDLLPLELLTIPAYGDRDSMTISKNAINSTDIFNALLWCYASGDTALTNTNGVVKINGAQVMSGSSLPSYNQSQATALLNYLYGKMGYRVLAGSDLSYANQMTRLGLSASYLSQRAVKIVTTSEE